MNAKNLSLQVRYLFWCAVLVLSLVQCANPISPTGGPRDEQPPQIDSTRSTPNLQTDFRPKTIELTFDEWIKLEQVNQQVVISPPLQGYEVRLKGKTVILDLGDEDTLRNNVTYVIQFGEAVKDLTESNPADDLRFVFSTGPYIDSLELSGQVVDAYTAEPVEKALVMLYDNLADSVFRTTKPFYFGRTNEQGQFRISNVRGGFYKVAALEDSDANYRFNQAAERIAFLTDSIELTADTSVALNLRLFREQLPLQLAEADSSRWGRLKLVFNREPTEELNLITDVPYERINQTDSLMLWHKEEQAWELIVAADTLLNDTIPVPAAPIANAVRPRNLSVINIPGSSPTRHAPQKPLAIGFDRPVSALDTSLINLLADTLLERLTYTWAVDSLNPQIVELDLKLKEQTQYALELLPGAVIDYWGVPSADTLIRNWTTIDRKSLGNLTIRFTDVDTTTQYHCRLLVSSKAPTAIFNHTGAFSYTNEFKLLPPGDYQLEIIEDLNGNSRWDPGNYDLKRQPERVYIRKLETLRANWDLEVDVDLSTIF
ncbi:MAG: Ig-like domain-containing protein [Bacteroidota bacterium]